MLMRYLTLEESDELRTADASYTSASARSNMDVKLFFYLFQELLLTY